MAQILPAVSCKDQIALENKMSVVMRNYSLKAFMYNIFIFFSLLKNN